MKDLFNDFLFTLACIMVIRVDDVVVDAARCAKKAIGEFVFFIIKICGIAIIFVITVFFIVFYPIISGIRSKTNKEEDCYYARLLKENSFYGSISLLGIFLFFAHYYFIGEQISKLLTFIFIIIYILHFVDLCVITYKKESQGINLLSGD
jgi:hypothetical protein